MRENKAFLPKLKIIDENSDLDSKQDNKISKINKLYHLDNFKVKRRKKRPNYIINSLKNKNIFKKEKEYFAKIFISFIITSKIIYFIIYYIILILIIKKFTKSKTVENSNFLKPSESIKFVNPIKFEKLHLISFNKYEFQYLKDKYYNINDFKYLFSFNFNIIKVEYNVGFFDKKKKYISPSDLSLYDDLHIFCHFEVVNQNITIDSLAFIFKNKFFKCIEFFKINEKVKFGIKIKKGKNNEYLNLYLFTEEIFEYNKNISINDNIFSPDHLKKNHEVLLQKLKTEKLNKKLRLKSIYIKYPICVLKRNSVFKEGEWNFKNIYNHYFCFCKGKKCSTQNVNQLCKFNFYKYIIDRNRHEYKKTDYLFIDFIFKEFGEDDTYPVFKEMGKDKSTHYLTEKSEIYKKFCFNKKRCLKIIPMDRILYNLYGDFIEKYLTLILKLKAVISAKPAPFHIMCNLFYNIEYITYIAVGHGLCYFKDFLYYKYQIYGVKMNNKLLIPPSYILVNLAKRYGWKEEDLIKINLPRWDKFNFLNKDILSLKNERRIEHNSILIMFTWRGKKPGKKISPYYFSNITDLMTNELLLKELKNNNITLYFTMHRFLYFKYVEQYKEIQHDSNFVFINQREISETLSKIDLIITDFSSVVFDIMYRNKPFIIYFPDLDEPNIDIIYTKNYRNVIKKMKKNKFGFRNLCFNINETIKKIIYYIKNNFTIENELKPFYDTFIPKRGLSIPKFIRYLKKLT